MRVLADRCDLRFCVPLLVARHHLVRVARAQVRQAFRGCDVRWGRVSDGGAVTAGRLGVAGAGLMSQPSFRFRGVNRTLVRSGAVAEVPGVKAAMAPDAVTTGVAGAGDSSVVEAGAPGAGVSGAVPGVVPGGVPGVVLAAGLPGVEEATPDARVGTFADVLRGLGRARDLVALASQAPFDGADAEDLAQVIAVGSRLRSAAEALLLASTAALEAAQAGSGRAALRSNGRLSARRAARVASVSEQIAEMPRVAHGLAIGELTPEHAEVLADTARRSSPHAVDTAHDLLGTAVTASPDVLRRDARTFVAEHDPMAAESEMRRQRRDRSAALFLDDETGMGVLNARFDPVSFASVAQAVESYNDALWRLDGGRDGTPGAVRDNRQRLADSVFEMLTGRNALAIQQRASVSVDGSASGDAGVGVGESGDARAAHGGAECDADGRADAWDHPGADSGRSIARWTPAGAPNQLVIVADIGVIDGTAPDGRCDVLGAGPVPKSILDSLSPDTRIAGALFAGPGHPLWLGRGRRLASIPQQLAIAIRDRGCVLCGAPMHRCKYHHIEEWEADDGTTDIPNLAAMCGDCHNSLHKGGQRLQRDPLSGHWITRKRPKRSNGQSNRSVGRSKGSDRTPRGAGPESGRDPPAPSL